MKTLHAAKLSYFNFQLSVFPRRPTRGAHPADDYPPEALGRVAAEVFGIADPAILSAIGCHTTLRAKATPLDMAVFVADKIAWDQPGDPPYLAKIQAAAERSLADAARVYVGYLWAQRETLAVIHPWLVAAHAELFGVC